MKVLVVDDDSRVLELVKTMVEELGHDVVAAAGGNEAWARLNESPVHVVVTDSIMPQTDGLELCRRIRAEVTREYTYVILLTMLDERSHYLKAIDAGVDDFLSKPFDPDLMAARLRVAERILGLQRHADRLERLLPICTYCKKIRDGEEWVSVEEFLGRETSREVTHGICSHCYDNVARPAIKRILEEQG
jgi:phosphoserine phosphatase RsbU/P